MGLGGSCVPYLDSYFVTNLDSDLCLGFSKSEPHSKESGENK